MDASKAVEALTSGDLFALATALEWDQRAEITKNDNRLFTGRIGPTQLTIHNSGDKVQIEGHVHDSADKAAECFDWRLADHQEQRLNALAMGLPIPTLTVDGVLTPVPDAPVGVVSIFDQVEAMLRGRGVMPTLVTVPDDLSGLDGTI